MEQITTIKKQLPKGFLEGMEEILGPDEAAHLAASLVDTPSVSLRFNRRKCDGPEMAASRFAGFSPAPVPWCGSGFYLDSRPEFIHDPLLHAGAYYVQEAASMIYETIMAELLESEGCPATRPLKVLDLCAAPGGKTTAMLNALAGDYVLVANEYERSRAGILRENLNKWGDPNIIITSAAARSLGRMKGFFDIIAVDAPCSGEGMLRREPVASSQWSPRLVEQCASLQRDILSDIIPALRPGGFLIYSTCTFNRRENEDNCRFLEENYDMTPVREGQRFMPHQDRCEGLFVAVFQKTEKDDLPGWEFKKPKKNLFIKRPGNGIFLKGASLEFAKSGDRIFALTPSVAEVYTALYNNETIHPVSAGVETGAMKGNLFIPSSRQVLSYLFDPGALPSIEISWEEAISYLHRQPLVLPAVTPKGYVCVNYAGYPLGLVKNIGNRANNLYPPEWRVIK